MATAKRDLTDSQVQGPRPAETTISLNAAAPGSDLRDAVLQMVTRARTEQGLPAKISDEATLARIAALLDPAPVE